MSIIIVAATVGGLVTFVVAVFAITWLLSASRRSDEQADLIDAWNDVVAIHTGLVALASTTEDA
jgi:hypothetical protein